MTTSSEMPEDSQPDDLASPDLSFTRRGDRPTQNYVYFALLIILIGLMLQMPCLSYEKVIDDHDLINSVDQRGCGPHPTDCFQHPVFELYYRPLFTATFALGDIVHPKFVAAANALRQLLPANLRGNRTLHYDDPIWYHLENLLLYAAVCGLAFWFFFLLFKRERPAFLAGLIFALHPLQVTVTTFIGGRPDSMALFFLLLFAIGAWNCTQSPASPRPAIRRFGWLLLSVLAYSCAVFTKEQCILMLLVLPLLLWRRGYVFPQSNLPWLVLYLPAIGLYIQLAKRIIPFSTVPQPHWSTPLHLEMIGRTMWYFERLLVFPNVGPIHQSTLGPWDIPQYGVAITGYLLTALWLTAIWKFWRQPAYRFCALWTTLTLFPCLNLIPIPSQFASCYRAVIPLLGFAGVLGFLLDTLFARMQSRASQADSLKTNRDETVGKTLEMPQILGQVRQYAPALCVVLALVVFYCWETSADVPNWQTNHTLMNAELYGDPNFVPAHHGQAFYYETQSDWKKVDEEFTMVLSSFMPETPPGPEFVKEVKGEKCQRALWSHAGLRYHPFDYLRWLLPHRGWARQEQGHFSAAIDDYLRALALNPDDDNTRANLRNCYMENGKVDEAMSLYRNASELPPSSNSNSEHTSP